ncbi:tetratricopeptide repeat protein [Sulfurovum sp.]|uniref:tetratricopeptide repeat protein n=1 Tax=Sulfurovum sp. TaxID=1969726 RepID=UPI003563A69B
MLIEQLQKQIGFLKRSCELFDEGYEDESIKIAVTLRTLFRDTHNSESLVKLLGQKDNIKLLSTIPIDEPFLQNKIIPNYIPIMLTSDGIKPYLEMSNKKELLFVNQWLNEKILLLDGEYFTREDVIVTSANKDGGTHTTNKPNRKMKLLKKSFGSFTVTEGNREISQDIKNHHLILLRQFAYEVLSSQDLYEQNSITFQSVNQTRTSKEYLIDAEKFRKENRHYKAIETCKTAIKLKSYNADIAYNNMGNSLAELNEDEDAKNAYYNAIAINDEYIEPLYNLSIIFVKEKRYDKAIELYEKILKIDPKNEKVKHNFTVIINLLRSDDEIIYQYENIFPQSSNVTYLTYLGISLYELKKYDLALIVSERTLELLKDDISILCNIGAIHIKLKNYDEAEEIFGKLCSIYPQPLHVFLNTLEYRLITNQLCEVNLVERHKEYFESDDNATMLITIMLLLFKAREGTIIEQDISSFKDKYNGLPINYDFVDIEEWVKTQNFSNQNLQAVLSIFKNWEI